MNKVFCYNACGQPIYLYKFADYDSSQILGSLVLYNHTELQDAVNACQKEYENYLQQCYDITES